ncbi:FAD/FMN-containing lactate dehydrogenase/glycolate oxidase [Edwardsiella anguillarum]|uniref:D-2-hydroxyglutarate dehydrogenase YdiJ n=1 Tax=Edwardsiella anguillarum TaxID=1821960 RepID=UPI0005EDEC52|nr:FAD-binding and (Fe-S)-binding domain-containing protein [Edwardsiella anguillarum]RFT05397.1 FAD-binding oxidoreductase [Edwardsiella anguillarum]BET80961.1 FAD/FMN-containing lactate dehydrogenase/glycolate oxidase [Edwardsiella anguillarum]BET84250.1 FAD/FMN-containing lactate dehydrogenase/glycolate oxidase [Edwardsiella anguillarum]BET87616.1 FAD/FMN-containing lactate dehydrogenase/glycolate oxidase [Edwardsiella anguillarum]BET91043.1 FAD/FMN-containing lactate dehydrogenase/glycolat
MIPRLSPSTGFDPAVTAFIQTLKQNGFNGECDTRYGARLTMATDNSIYQLLPDAILFPRSTAEVVAIARLAQEAAFRHLSLTARGGGTGTNGQALNGGIVVDMSRHMQRILEINLQEGWVRVEAGVVKDQLNALLKPHGYFFAPELSTSNRATLGGMINTDACGQGSRVYGKTSDYILGLRSVLLGGDILDTAPLPIRLAQTLARQGDRIGEIYRGVLEVCLGQREAIVAAFPPLSRFLTGYDLRHVLSDDLQRVDLSRLLAGSEGTLALVTEARLRIIPLPQVRRLVNVTYDSFDAALRNAPLMLEANALSVETIDSQVLALARRDIIWHGVRDLIDDRADRPLQGLNIVEFAGDDARAIAAQVTALCQRLEAMADAGEGGVIGYRLCSDEADIERIYGMRKRAVGLLGNAQGAAKPIPFVEDTCVPPPYLADYIAEFRTILDQYQLSYGMFGHVDAGVLHVRPALDMCDPRHEALVSEISDRVVALTAKYGGLLWGEHGKGFRAQYSPAFFGAALYHELRRIKSLFDADNRMNPGKICPPLGCDAPMKQVDAVKRGTFDRQIPAAVRGAFRGALECNGNGLCFNFDRRSPMCPSLKVSGDRLHSPKGRAALMREWLRLLAEQGVDPLALEQRLGTLASLRALIAKTRRGWRARAGEYDFSHEVKAAMDGCLSCKACSSQCPIKIDVPAFRARFLQLYHTRYLRPLRDHLVAGVERYTPWMARAPRVFNFFLRQPLLGRLSERCVGMTDLPQLSAPTLRHALAGHPALLDSLESLEGLDAAARARRVLIVQDPFTSYYDARVVEALIRLCDRLGLRAQLLPFVPNGKAQHIKGFLRRFARTARSGAEFLNRVARLGIPLVGVDPAMVLCYRDEYKTILGEQRGEFQVQLIQEWLAQALPSAERLGPAVDETWYLFGHCTETCAEPASVAQWQQVFAHLGARLQNVSVGCCGMAGTYGHEVANQAASRGIYALSWQPALAALPPARCLATGYSCRSQVLRQQGVALRHPVQALLEICDDLETRDNPGAA